MSVAAAESAAAQRAPAAGPEQVIDLRRVNAVQEAIQAGRLTQVRRTTLGGNDAIAQAALEAGARFFGGYPITPSTEVLEYSARYIMGHGGSYLQMEDEIAGIAAAIGASLGGVKAFTGTSGPGFSLKQENLGYACILEIPLVVVNVMRGGPSTGGPTDVGQSDVMQARWGTHGDHPIVAIAPATAQECWGDVRAFNIAEIPHTGAAAAGCQVGQMKEPLVRRRSIWCLSSIAPIRPARPGLRPRPDLSACRRWRPAGEGYRSHFTGLYHNRKGLPTKDVRLVDQLQKRIHAKLETREAQADILKTEEFFAEDAEVLVVAYGITARAAKDAVLEARAQASGLLRPSRVAVDGTFTQHLAPLGHRRRANSASTA
jgi:2-oxoglutarate ferredoxin oxidoreductase subunit alpha